MCLLIFHHRFRFSLIATALMLVCLSVDTVWANPPSVRQIVREITDQLDVLTSNLNLDDYEQVLFQLDREGLKQGEVRTWDLLLEDPGQYMIAAVCDNDCQNIDLELWNSNALLQHDHRDNPYPQISTQLAAGTYRVSIVMQQCEIEPCYSGLRVFRQE